MAGEDWGEWPFEEVIDFQEGPGILAEDFRDEGVPLVRLAGLSRGSSVLNGCNHLDPAMVEKRWGHFVLQQGDVLLSTSASLGRIAVVEEDGVGAISYTGIIRMRPRDNRLHGPFIRYLLEGPEFQEQAEMAGVGSVIRHFGPMHLRQMSVRLPAPDEQRAIAHILGTLDDKIELNRRMNETLEAMARTLFQSWFVDFDPVRAKRRGEPMCSPQPGQVSQSGHAPQSGQAHRPAPTEWPQHILDLFPDRFVDSELGEIPEGWEVKKLGELLDLAYGKALKAENRCEGSVPVYGSNGQVGWHDERLVAGPGIVVGRKGNPGVATWVQTDFFPIDTTFYVVPGLDCQSLQFLFQVLRTHDLTSLGADSAVPGLNRNLAYMSDQLLPPAALLAEFEARASVLSRRVNRGNDESRTLSALRDTLLPKLISGELRVKDAERFIGRVI